GGGGGRGGDRPPDRGAPNLRAGAGGRGAAVAGAADDWPARRRRGLRAPAPARALGARAHRGLLRGAGDPAYGHGGGRRSLRALARAPLRAPPRRALRPRRPPVAAPAAVGPDPRRSS